MRDVKSWRIVQNIYENEETEPTLTHVFYGETQERAQQVFDAHMKTDAFMRGCVTNDRFRDFACHAQNHFERFISGEWVHV